MHPDALLTTPVHAAANRTREDARGAGRHGSCGLGIGETTWYDLATRAGVRAGQLLENFVAPSAAADLAVRVRDCLDERVLTRKLDALAAFYRPLLETGVHAHPEVARLVEVYTEFAARNPGRRRAAPRRGCGRSAAGLRGSAGRSAR